VRSSDLRTWLNHIGHSGRARQKPGARAIRCARGEPLRETYERIAKRRGRQVAKVAVARKILTLCF
jgi:hypothetical protein